MSKARRILFCVKYDDEWFAEGQFDSCSWKKSIVIMLRSIANKSKSGNFVTLMKDEDVLMALTGE